ncbi:MAG: ferredoxin oxidoreductase [Chloroflexi bacterium GWB2_49_20]|nr:MAG: ferredoxin oxidoreductase [Chloroflexi bacterium GWB2_49_20]OGN80023.1 MAG: ferredoxin oxidoreductase [Chloroflexi bacterium GWC2_49_37]OGN85441.1 MAG: ferredoxin oxidoreductase [Chloroflexi bacterium GWD2_49_16]HBG74305.1 2-oxoacid:acceptor oxidoreductase subunit alpha [Anaerolineae bacterium]HCM97085.1 2-oxoacid:acceptor oxidoreductase subunit alpha [Anaerolineae bacterium]
MAAQNKIINNFSITIATVNGSGSQTANTTLLRALFKMGIPVSGKNLFPSNIQGLPTWYTIRVSKDGFTARRDEQEVFVCMNPASFEKDLAEVLPGGAFFYADHIKNPITRTDISVYPMPIRKLVKTADVSPGLRDYIANMIYVGILAHTLGIDLEKIHSALDFHFKGKPKPIESNINMVKAGAEWASKNLSKSDPYWVEPMDKTKGLIMADGNTAGALGAIYGGVQFAAWYPITPASSLAESLNEYLPKLRKNAEGKHTYAVVQAEDELSAIGMTVGAGWSGLRSMTSTSGPGLSLMTEYAGMAYFAEVPIVVWDVQRIGPSTGLPTRTSQGDLTFTNFMGHGDTQHVILLPGSVNECFEFGSLALDLAEHLQTPIFVLSDLDLGMNQWMTDAFRYPDKPLDRGKVLWEEDLEKIKGDWGRYKDIDGDGIPYRTLVGNRHPKSGYFARGTGHDEYARYSENPQVWEANMNRLRIKYKTARTIVPKPIIDSSEKSDIGIITFGSNEPAVYEARTILKLEGITTDYLRLRAIPFTNEVAEFVKSHKRVYIVETNHDGQLNQLITIELPGQAKKFKSICLDNGLSLSASWIKEKIQGMEAK